MTECTTNLHMSWCRSGQNYCYWTYRDCYIVLPYVNIVCLFVNIYRYLDLLIEHVAETGFVTRLTRRVPQVVQELHTLPEHLSVPPVCSGVRVTRSLVLCVCFVHRCLSFWPLCCLVFFDLQIRITPLVSSNSFYYYLSDSFPTVISLRVTVTGTMLWSY
jgi:hypothetical protein